MKKVSEMNGNEKIAWRNIKGVFDWEVGGWYNCIQDDCTEYIPNTYKEAFALIYEEAMNDAASGGHYIVGRAPKEMRFAGKEFIEECLAHLFRTDGDVEGIAEVKGWDTTKELGFEIIEE